MGPMERLKVSEEGIIVTKPMNTISLVESEQKKKNEHAAKPGMGGLHRHHCSKFEKKKEKKKRGD